MKRRLAKKIHLQIAYPGWYEIIGKSAVLKWSPSTISKAETVTNRNNRLPRNYAPKGFWLSFLGDLGIHKTVGPI